MYALLTQIPINDKVYYRTRNLEERFYYRMTGL